MDEKPIYLDIRTPIGGHSGEPVTVTFHIGKRRVQFGPRRRIATTTPFVHSEIVQEADGLIVVGKVWWGANVAFQTAPTMVRKGDTMTIKFGEAS